MKTITKIFIAIIGTFGLIALNSYPVLAVSDVCSSNASSEVKEAAGCNGSGDQFSSVIANILKAVIGICGLVAVVFIVIGGVQYMTSSGDAGKLKQAKNTILYALIGLIICALAFTIVNWVITGVLDQ